MPQDPERAPLIRVTSPQEGSVAHAVKSVRGDREPSWVQSLSWIIFGSYFNVFLAFVPLSFVAQQKNWDVLYRFGFSFFAIVPLAKVCATSSDGFIVFLAHSY